MFKEHSGTPRPGAWKAPHCGRGVSGSNCAVQKGHAETPPEQSGHMRVRDGDAHSSLGKELGLREEFYQAAKFLGGPFPKGERGAEIE